MFCTAGLLLATVNVLARSVIYERTVLARSINFQKIPRPLDTANRTAHTLLASPSLRGARARNTCDTRSTPHRADHTAAPKRTQPASYARSTPHRADHAAAPKRTQPVPYAKLRTGYSSRMARRTKTICVLCVESHAALMAH